MKDYYYILNINRSSTDKEIKRAYRQAVLFWHPDKNDAPNAHDKFIEINEAYNILIDIEKRRTYDYLYDLSLNPYKISIEYEKYRSKSESYENWIKDEQIKSEKLSSLSIDDVLTETFHFIDRYGCLIFFLVLSISLLFIFISTNKL